MDRGSGTGYLNGPVAGAFHLEAYPLPALVELDDACLALDGHDCARLVRGVVDSRVGQRKRVVGRDGQKGAVQGLVEVAIVGADGVVDGDEVGAGGEGALNHQLGQRRDDRGKHVAAAEHGLAHGHEVGHGVVAIADQLGSGAQQGAVQTRWAGRGAVPPGDCLRSEPAERQSVGAVRVAEGQRRTVASA